MIKIISGTCQTALGLKRPGDKPFSLTPEAEKRLVDRKVAVYVFENFPMEPVATPPIPPMNQEAGVISAETENPAEGQKTDGESGVVILDIAGGHYTKDSLLRMTRGEMEKMADALGIDIKGCKNKSDIADRIADVEVAADEQAAEDPPILAVEDPVP